MLNYQSFKLNLFDNLTKNQIFFEAFLQTRLTNYHVKTLNFLYNSYYALKLINKIYLEIPKSIPEHNVKSLIGMFFFLDR